MFFHFYKKHKNMHKNIKLQYHSSKKHGQYEANKVNNTATKHSTSDLSRKLSLCPWEIHHVFNFVLFWFNNNKNTALKSTKKPPKNKKHTQKHVF